MHKKTSTEWLVFKMVSPAGFLTPWPAGHVGTSLFTVSKKEMIISIWEQNLKWQHDFSARKDTLYKKANTKNITTVLLIYTKYSFTHLSLGLWKQQNTFEIWNPVCYVWFIQSASRCGQMASPRTNCYGRWQIFTRQLVITNKIWNLVVRD